MTSPDTRCVTCGNPKTSLDYCGYPRHTMSPIRPSHTCSTASTHHPFRPPEQPVPVAPSQAVEDPLSVSSGPSREGVCNRCDGTGISPSDPKGKFCVKCYGTGAYNPNFNFHIDGRVEEVCEHGVGHTVSIRAVNEEDSSWWVHGCDGCCKDMVKYA